ncbi:MAG TPA: hypothetical protein VH186_37830 [Chloroflexia bacterium]|nr:hypothetical protein [Chloroflexia bacterium]
MPVVLTAATIRFLKSCEYASIFSFYHWLNYSATRCKSSLTRVEQKAHHYGLLTSQQQQENQKLSEKVEALTTSLAKAVEKSAEQALLIEQLKQQVSLLEKLSLQYYQMGNTLDQIKNLEKPKTPLETRLQEEPTLEVSSSGVANYTNENTFRSQFKLAVETAKAARIKDAHTQFKVLLKQYPNDTSLLHWLAFTSSERQEAKAYLDKIQVINPKHPQLEMAYEWLAKLPSS